MDLSSGFRSFRCLKNPITRLIRCQMRYALRHKTICKCTRQRNGICSILFFQSAMLARAYSPFIETPILV